MSIKDLRFTHVIGVAILAALIVLIIVVAGGEGDDNGGASANSDEDAIMKAAQGWSNAYAQNDPAYCEFTPAKDRNLCRQYLATGKPSVYQAGYTNAVADGIEIDGTKANVTLTNGCVIVMEETTPDEWLVVNSGGNLAANCQQGTGR
jgi:hypothetical protein